MEFRLVQGGEREKYTPDLSRRFPLVETENGLWIVKHKAPPPNTARYDHLGYLLGSKVANVPEVRRIKYDELNDLRHLTGLFSVGATTMDTFLVRPCSSYSVWDLRAQTLEEAVATELVYSTWIRRRDTHAYNRTYISGIPMFYDHETAFGAEPQFAYGPAFFRSKEDHGHAGFWRVREINTVITTEGARGFRGEPAEACHYVNNIEEFNKALVWAENLMHMAFDRSLVEEIANAGFPDTAEVGLFLRYNLLTLHHDLNLMRNVIFKE